MDVFGILLCRAFNLIYNEKDIRKIKNDQLFKCYYRRILFYEKISYFCIALAIAIFNMKFVIAIANLKD